MSMSAEVPEPEKVCKKCKEPLFRLDDAKDWRTVIGFKGACKKGGPHAPEALPEPVDSAVIDWDDWDSTLGAWTKEQGF